MLGGESWRDSSFESCGAPRASARPDAAERLRPEVFNKLAAVLLPIGAVFVLGHAPGPEVLELAPPPPPSAPDGQVDDEADEPAPLAPPVAP